MIKYEFAILIINLVYKICFGLCYTNLNLCNINVREPNIHVTLLILYKSNTSLTENTILIKNKKCQRTLKE